MNFIRLDKQSQQIQYFFRIFSRLILGEENDSVCWYCRSRRGSSSASTGTPVNNTGTPVNNTGRAGVRYDHAGGVKLIPYWLRSSPPCCKLNRTRGRVCCQCADDHAGVRSSRAGGVNLIPYWLRSSPPCCKLAGTRGRVF